MQVQEVCYGCAHVCISHKSDTIPIFWKSDTFQTWCSCGWLSITPYASSNFATFQSLILVATLLILNLSLLVAFSFIYCKSVEGVPHLLVFFMYFKFWYFFIKLKIEKIIGYCLTIYCQLSTYAETKWLVCIFSVKM